MELSVPMAVALVSGAAVGAGIAIYLARTARLRAGDTAPCSARSRWPPAWARRT